MTQEDVLNNEGRNWLRLDGMRQLSPWMHYTAFTFFILFFVYVVCYIVDIFFMLGFPLFGLNKVITYGVVLFFIFLLVPAGKKSVNFIPWYDFLLAFSTLASSIYLIMNWEGIFYGVRLPALPLQIFAGIMIFSTLEAARRSLGWAFTLIGSFFVIYPLFGNHFPSVLFTRNFSFERLSEVMYYSESGIYGSAMELFATIMVIFFIFGAFINQSKTSNLLMDSGYALTGGYRGGPAKVSIMTSGLFSSISGVGAANVAATGNFTIPLMKNYGFSPKMAAAIEATASSGGTLMPPIMGAAAFLMADFLGVPYWDIMMAALIPAVFYYVALYVMVDAIAGKNKMVGIPANLRPSFRATMKQYGHFLIPIIIFVLSIGYFAQRPDTAALYAIGSLVVVSYCRISTRMGYQDIGMAIYKGIFGFLKLAPAAAVVGIIMASVNMTGLSVTLVSGLRDLAAGNLYLLLLYVALAAIILGMGSSPLLVYILLFVLLVPAMVDLGVMPIAAHFYIFYFSVASLLTPPVALSVIMAAGLARTDFWPVAWEAVKLSIIVFIIPFVFVLDPALLMQGTVSEILYSITVTLIGVVFLAGSFVGYLYKATLTLLPRLLSFVGAVTLIMPGGDTDIIGIGLLALLFLILFMGRQKSDVRTTTTSTQTGDSK